MKKFLKKLAKKTGLVTFLKGPGSGIPDLFDYEWYCKYYLLEEKTRKQAFDHYRKQGWKQGNLPTPLFNPVWYLDRNPDIAAAEVEPFMHYYHQGWREGRRPNEWFDPSWYLAQYTEVGEHNIDPLTHYVVAGRQKGYLPIAGFDEQAYVRAHPAAASSGLIPFAHMIFYQRPVLRLDVQIDGLGPAAEQPKAVEADREVVPSKTDRPVDPARLASKHIVIHIGFPKTATSSIQLGLWNDREELAKMGFLYPESGVIAGGHHNLSYEMRSNPRFQPEVGGIDQLIAEIAESDLENVIISSEDFAGIIEPKIHRFREAFGGAGFTIVAYLRRQDEFLQSFWAQLVKTGYYTDSFESWLKRRYFLYHADLDVIHGDYHSVLQPWINVFGAENMIVRPFERSQIKGDVFHEFLGFCRVPRPKRLEVPGIHNVSPSNKTLEVIRKIIGDIAYLSKYDLVRVVEGQQDAPEPISMSIASAILEFSDVKGWNSTKVNALDERLHHQIMAEFDEGNRKISELFLDGSPLFIEPFKPKAIETGLSAEISTDELNELTAFILRNLLVK